MHRKLPVWATLGEACRLWARNVRSFAVLGIAVMLPIVVVSDLIDEIRPEDTVSAATVFVSSVALAVVGESACTGLAEHIARHGAVHEDRTPLRTHLAALPLRRLAIASVVVGAIVLAGFVLLIVPGLVALVWLSLVTPVISFERVSVWRALGRSLHLVRGAFWPVAALTWLTLVPVLAVEQVMMTVDDLFPPLWIEMVLDALLQVVVVTISAAVIVTIFNRLRQVPPVPRTGAATGPTPVPDGS